MIEIGFSIILGFAITSTLCGLMADNSREDRILMRALAYLIVLTSVLAFANGGSLSVLRHTQILVVTTFTDRLVWFTLGSALALVVQLIAEGHIHTLWVRFHPQSAPTPEARMGPQSLTRRTFSTRVRDARRDINRLLKLRIGLADRHANPALLLRL